MSGGVKQGVLVALESHQLLSGGANNQDCIHSCLRLSMDVSTPHPTSLLLSSLFYPGGSHMI